MSWPPSNDMGATLTIRQAAELSGRQPEAIRQWCRDGTLVARKNPQFPTRWGGRWEIDPESFEAVVLAAAGRRYVRSLHHSTTPGAIRERARRARKAAASSS